MSSDVLPPEVQARNRELIAKRSGWPPTALSVCNAAEARHPGWIVYYSKGGLPRTPEPGYYARHERDWAQVRSDYAADPDGIDTAIGAGTARRLSCEWGRSHYGRSLRAPLLSATDISGQAY